MSSVTQCEQGFVVYLDIQTSLTFRRGNEDSCYLLNMFSTFDRLDEETGVHSQTCTLTCTLYLYVISEILEDETASDYDTNATLKAKTLYKSCIDTGKNCLNFLRVRLYWSESDDIASIKVHREFNLMSTLGSDRD